MKKIFLSILLVISLLNVYTVYADESVGWMPKWNVGDWWIVVIEYDSSAYSPISGTVPKKLERVELKFSVVSEENLEGEDVYKVEMRAANKAPHSPTAFDLYILKEKLVTRKLVIYDHESKIRDEYILDRDSTGNFYGLGQSNLYVLPNFPLVAAYNEQRNSIHFRGSYLKSDYREFPQRTVRQKREIINGDILKTIEKVKKEYLDSKIYKITFEKQCIEYWSEKIPWYIYFEKDGIVKGYLQEYHSID